MASGGARNRSGPPPAEHSARSDRRGYSLTALPAEGFKGKVPAFPLPKRVVYCNEWSDEQKVVVRDEEATKATAARELELWKWAWRTPQACAWSMPSERWRWHTIAMWVRTAVICESSEATAADKNSLHRFADQIGLTTAGMAEIGWKIAADELAAKAAERTAPAQQARPRRLRPVPDGAS